MLIRKLNQAGDTIVEVMIVLAVLGLAIGIAYAAANRSLENARQAQENAEAVQLATTEYEPKRVSVTPSAKSRNDVRAPPT